MHWMLVAAAFLAAVGSARAETCDRHAFEHCQACHALSKDAGQKPGPQLVGVIGRPRPSAETEVISTRNA